MDQLDQYSDAVMEMLLQYLPQLVLAILTLFAGTWLIKRAVALLESSMTTRGVDKTLVLFVRNLSNVVMKVLLFIIVISMIGVETTSLIAVLGAAGLAVGLSLQGSLSNFAGGVLIILSRPFRVGDLIRAQGFLGTVAEVHILYTILKTPDNQRVIIPNGVLSNDSIVNVNAEPIRRVDMTVGIGYDDDIVRAKEIIQQILQEDPRVLDDPAPAVEVVELADSAINLVIRPWSKAADYWEVYFSTYAVLKERLAAVNISIPYPQRDVHLIQSVPD